MRIFFVHKWWSIFRNLSVMVAFVAITFDHRVALSDDQHELGDELLSKYVGDAIEMSQRYAFYFKGRSNQIDISRKEEPIREREFVILQGESRPLGREYEAHVGSNTRSLPPGIFVWREFILQRDRGWLLGHLSAPFPPPAVIARRAKNVIEFAGDDRLKRKEFMLASFSPLKLAVGSYGSFLAGQEQASSLTEALHYVCVKAEPSQIGGFRTFHYVTHGGINIFKCTFSQAHGNRPVRSVWSRMKGDGEAEEPFSIIDTSWQEVGGLWTPTRFEAMYNGIGEDTRQLVMIGEWFAREDIEEKFFPDASDQLWYEKPVRYFQEHSNLLEGGMFQPFDDFRAHTVEKPKP